MRREDKLKEKVGQGLPYSVPEGYFESLRANVMAGLPEYPAKPRVPKLTAWQRLRPYIYLAAMFAGIWCMMQIFHRVSSPPTPSEDHIASYFEPDSYDLFIEAQSGNDLEIEDEVQSLYPSVDEFRKDFYAQL